MNNDQQSLKKVCKQHSTYLANTKITAEVVDHSLIGIGKLECGGMGFGRYVVTDVTRDDGISTCASRRYLGGDTYFGRIVRRKVLLHNERMGSTRKGSRQDNDRGETEHELEVY